MPKVQSPLAFHVMAKPTGAKCNLDCSYCFYLTKEALYPDSDFRMREDVQRQYIRQYIQAQHIPEVHITWQGGEPTLMGLDFFRRSVKLAQQYKKFGMQVNYALQTNGLLLTEEWCQFLRLNNFLVGLSMDGPQALHDAFRVDKGGRTTFNHVMRAARMLKEHQVDFNILCTLHAANAEHPLEIYHFFRDEVGARFIQFIPIVERLQEEHWNKDSPSNSSKEEFFSYKTKHTFYTQSGNRVSSRSISAEQYGNFLSAVFDEWVRNDVGKIFVQLFDVALANWVGAPPGLCIHSETCGNALALEHNGDLYACDHFVEPAYLLGNIKQTPMVELVASPVQRQFGLNKRDHLPRFCQECPVRFACHGGCPKDRFNATPDGEPRLNYLCAGYRHFFAHIGEAMQFMAGEIRHSRPPANVMTFIHNNNHR